MIVLVPKYEKLGEGFSKVDILNSNEEPGRRTNPARGYQSPATWIDHLVQLRRGVILCTACRFKFNPKRYHYRRFYAPQPKGTDPYATRGRCDDCKQDTNRVSGGGTFFVPEEVYAQVCFEPSTVRQRMRHQVRLAASTVWNAIKNNF